MTSNHNNCWWGKAGANAKRSNQNTCSEVGHALLTGLGRRTFFELRFCDLGDKKCLHRVEREEQVFGPILHLRELLPFAEHTQTLQSDTMSMCLVVPALLDLLSHLADYEENTSHRDLAGLALKMKGGIRYRFACILDPI